MVLFCFFRSVFWREVILSCWKRLHSNLRALQKLLPACSCPHNGVLLTLTVEALFLFIQKTEASLTHTSQEKVEAAFMVWLTVWVRIWFGVCLFFVSFLFSTLLSLDSFASFGSFARIFFASKIVFLFLKSQTWYARIIKPHDRSFSPDKQRLKLLKNVLTFLVLFVFFQNQLCLPFFKFSLL